MGKFDRYAFSAQPSFDEAATRKAFSKAVPLKTLVIYCYDPRAAEIPNAVAKLFGDEVFPGDIIHDDHFPRHRRRRPCGRRASVDHHRAAFVRDSEHRRRSPLPLRRYKLYGRWDHQRLRARTPR